MSVTRRDIPARTQRAGNPPAGRHAERPGFHSPDTRLLQPRPQGTRAQEAAQPLNCNPPPCPSGLLEPCARKPASTVLRGPRCGNAPGLPDSAMIEQASSALTPGISSSRMIAGSAGASGMVPAPAPVTPSGSAPHAAGIASMASSISSGEPGDPACRGSRSGPAGSGRARRGGRRTGRRAPRPGRRAWLSSGCGPARPARRGSRSPAIIASDHVLHRPGGHLGGHRRTP